MVCVCVYVLDRYALQSIDQEVTPGEALPSFWGGSPLLLSFSKRGGEEAGRDGAYYIRTGTPLAPSSDDGSYDT